MCPGAVLGTKKACPDIFTCASPEASTSSIQQPISLQTAVILPLVATMPLRKRSGCLAISAKGMSGDVIRSPSASVPTGVEALDGGGVVCCVVCALGREQPIAPARAVVARIL